MPPSNAQRISTAAYEALRAALPVVFWYRKSYRQYLNTALRNNPELMSGLNFDLTKREVADDLIDRLIRQEAKYRDVSIQLMLEISGMESFPELERHENSEMLLAQASSAVNHLRGFTREFGQLLLERERVEAEAEARRAQEDVRRRFSDDISSLAKRYRDFDQPDVDPHKRGKEFERFLRDLFDAFDLEPRLSYNLPREQIDGSFSFDTDDYILEAKWTKETVSRDVADVFAKKVERKGKNALGLLISVHGFSRPALDEYSDSTPFMTLDGADIFAVLDQRVRLDDLLRIKKRHANDTGSCHFPAYKLFGS